MDSQQVPQIPVPQPSIPSSSSKLSLIFIMIILLIIVGGGAYYLGKNSNKTAIVQTVSTSPSPIKMISPTSGQNIISPTPVKLESKIEDIKKKLEGEKNIYVDVIDQSPVDINTFAYGATPENYANYGIYLYNSTTNQSIIIWEFPRSIVGRGGIYTDNLEMRFAPDGKMLFLNKTGTNIPSLLILKTGGTIIYQSASDLGHPTWLNSKELLFVKSSADSPFILDVNTKQTKATHLPSNIFGLKINPSGSRLLSYVLDPQLIDGCQIMDLVIFSYPEGKKLTTVKNVLRSLPTASWVSNDTVTYREVTGCKDQDMFPTPLYSDYKQFKLP